MSFGYVIRSFVSGLLVGSVGAIGIAFYLLTTPTRTTKENKGSAKDSTKKESNNQQLSTQNDGLLSEECREMLEKTINLLDLQMNNHQQQQQQYNQQRSIQDSVGDESVVTTSASRAHLELEYTDFHEKSKERTRQLKLMAQMCQDIGKAYHSFGKHMSTISSSAKSNMSKKLAEGDPVDEWMRAFSHLAEALSTDSEEVGKILSAESGVFSHISLISDYLGAKDKLLGNEGSKIILALRESQQLMEKKGDERDRFREKLSAGGAVTTTSAVGAGQSSAGGTTLQKVIDMATHIKQQAEEEVHKLSVQKLQASELALLDHSHTHEETEREFEKVMTRILKLYKKGTDNAVFKARQQLTTMVGAIKKCYEKSDTVTQRFQNRVAGGGLVGHESSLKNTLEHMQARAQAQTSPSSPNTVTAGSPTTVAVSAGSPTTVVSLTPGTFSPPCPPGAVKLDMTLEATSILAATAPANLPPLPPAFRTVVDKETCVWFNAFSGRVYRDAASSAHFRAWLLQKLTFQLNRNSKTRPGTRDDGWWSRLWSLCT